ncbi:DUF2971 domain-containing protein [Humibacillus xanthopallidus]|uniref:DUF2971 domain-containing protein n=1 Tax=Humibacillus xanthopallidus TaxID=412689 RepID=UPI00163A13E3|nr:DUF2971 domain-containing protein [Humibacillus xanthopallidus]
MQGRVIWATDAEYLNDSQELRYARDHLAKEFRSASERLAGRAKEPHTEDPDTSSAAILSAALTALEGGDEVAPSSAVHVFVACFCEDGDLLSQWRGYAAGAGYAVGLDTDALETAVLGPMPHQELPVRLVGLRRVSYGDDLLRPRVDALVARVIEQPSAHPYVMGDHLARGEILPMLAEFKHPAFAEEQEWRLIATDQYGEPVNFRPGPLGPTPYVEFDFGSALVEVKVGPGPHQELRQRAVQRLVPCGVAVTLSDAPFRG